MHKGVTTCKEMVKNQEAGYFLIGIKLFGTLFLYCNNHQDSINLLRLGTYIHSITMSQITGMIITTKKSDLHSKIQNLQSRRELANKSIVKLTVLFRET